MYSYDVRRIATCLYNKLNSLRKVAQILNTSHSTISRWVNHDNNRQRRHRTKKIDGQPIIDAINGFLATHPFATLKDIRSMLLINFNITASIELVRLAIKRFNFSKKRARYFSEPTDDAIKLQHFLDERANFVAENRTFVSIDETSFGRNYQPAIGYAKKGSRLNVKRVNVHVATQSVVAAVAINQPIQFRKQHGSFRTTSYLEFLSSLTFPSKTVMIMDNVAFHKSTAIKELVLSRGWDILYTPPYIPGFNPIEGVFSIVKRHYQRNMNIEGAFASVQLAQIEGFFRGSFNATNRHS